MFVAQKKTLKVDIDGGIRDRFLLICQRKNISQVGAVEGLLAYFSDLDDVHQSMVLGQVEQSQDLTEIVLKRMAAKKGRRPDEKK